MRKGLALSALLANSNASASATAIVRTAIAFSPIDNAILAHGGGTAASLRSNADPLY